jgi:hypothetical protein
MGGGVVERKSEKIVEKALKKRIMPRGFELASIRLRVEPSAN